MESFKQRTYGKRASMKRKQEVSSSSITGRPTTPTSANTKRRKVDSPPTTTAKRPSPSLTETMEMTDDDEHNPLKISESKPTYKVLQEAKAKMHLPLIGRKLTDDLSGLIDAVVSPSPSASSTKLARRMLGRSKTETSIESPAAEVRANLFGRTPSLPTIPPSPPSKPRESSDNPLNSSSALLPILPPTTKTNTRTYAGKFRSFLVTLPSSNSQSLDAEEEFDTRESYNSLRSRWDVDNSEDDPYPYRNATPSPSKVKSASATPEMSPFRAGKGKSKANTSAVRPPPIPYGMSNPVKSISELRNKGESRRFVDELGYLFEGMDRQGGLGLRRASALEITTKLCDDDFTRKAKAADLFTRTWDLFIEAGCGREEDKILDILLVFFVALVARDPTSLAELIEQPASPPSSPSGPSKRRPIPKEAKNNDNPFFSTLFRILGSNSPDLDPLLLIAPQASASDVDLKKAGINKKDRTMLSTIYKTIISKSNLFLQGSILSIPLLIAFALQALPPRSIPAKYFPAFLTSLRATLSSDPSTSLSSSLLSRWLDAAKAVPYQNVYCHLQLLDAYLLDQWDTQPDDSSQHISAENNDYDHTERNNEEMNKARETWLADDLVALGICIELHKSDSTLELFPKRRYLDITLRVLVSLTHTDKLWGAKLLKGDHTLSWLMRTLSTYGRALQLEGGAGVKKEEYDGDVQDGVLDGTVASVRMESQALDTLCLALGLLTNLVQMLDEAKGLVREIHVDPSCSLKKRACIRQCACARRSSGIQILADLHAQQQAKIDSSTVPLEEYSAEAYAEADASFLRGHLAVLFGLLMMGSPENEDAVLAAVPSPFSASSDAKKLKVAKREKFARLVEHVKDFAALYTALSDSIGGEKESKVTSNVVQFLETKRDGF